MQQRPFALAHFTGEQLTCRPIIEKNLDVILKGFTDKGGELKSAEIRIFGGNHGREHYRKNLKEVVKKKIPDCEVMEPQGHYTVGNEAIDYLFRPKGITFCRAKASEENPLKDEFSSDLLDAEGKVDMVAMKNYRDALSGAASTVGRLYAFQVNNRNAELTQVAEKLGLLKDSDKLLIFSEAQYEKLKPEEQKELHTALETLPIKAHDVNREPSVKHNIINR